MEASLKALDGRFARGFVGAESKWVRFEKQPPLSGRTTLRYFVINKTGNFRLGVIQWENRWRQYVFAPDDNTIYARSCLTDIGRFIESLMEERRG